MVFNITFYIFSAVGLLDSRSLLQKSISKVMDRNFLGSIHLTGTLSNKSMVANTTRETVSFLLPVATNFILAYTAMMRRYQIIQSTGKNSMCSIYVIFFELRNLTFHNSFLIDCLNICRKSITKMMCMKCLMIQPIDATCSTVSCHNLSMAKYYCRICKLFDDER